MIDELSKLQKLLKNSNNQHYFNKVSDLKKQFFNMESMEIQVPGGGTLDMINHPLGKMILDYVKKVFMISDDGMNDVREISVKDFESISEFLIKFDKNFNFYNTIDRNPNPLTVKEFKELLKKVVIEVKKNFAALGKLNISSIVSFIEILEQDYEDVLLEEYFNMHSTEKDFAQFPKYEVDYPQIEELSPRRIKELNQMNDDSLKRTMNQPSKEYKDYNRERDKKQYPEKWHHILFDS